MGRIGTFLRLWREGRREEIRATLTRQALPAWLFRRNEMVITRLTRVRPLPRPLENISIRWGSREDEEALLRIRPRSGGYAANFDRGDLLVVGEVSGEVASFNWFETNRVHISRSNGYTFDMGPGAAWVYGFEVEPRFRMSGVFHKHWVVAMDLLAGRGIERVYGSIQADNPRSINSHRRLGFEIVYTFRVLRLAGLIHHEAVPAEGTGLPPSRGFGRWRGADTSAAAISSR